MFSGKSSLRHRLPAGIALIVAVAVSVFGVLAYTAARRATESAAWVRLRSVSNRFAEVTRVSMAARIDLVTSIARDPRVIAFLDAKGDPGGARAALERLGPDTGLTLAVGLRDATGAERLALRRALPALPTAATDIGDSTHVTRIFERDGAMEFEVIAPVRRGNRTLGYVAQRRVIRSTPATVNTLRGLMGSTAVLLVGNRDGSFWSDLIRPVDRPFMADGDQTVERADQKWIVTTSTVPGTPWAIAVEQPYARVVAPLGKLLWIFGGLAAVVVAAGAVAGWFLSRRVTDPLVRLTAAAESIAAGQQTAEHAIAVRNDEVGRLDHAFSIMARSVEQAREQLEQQVSERTAALELAQHELIRTEKMAVLGQLASSVGHELRNPLGVMSNIVYYLTTTLTDAPPKARNHLVMLKRQVMLAEKIVSDILDFTRVKVPETREVEVAPFIDEQLQRIAVPGFIRVEREIAHDLPKVHADPVQIGQVMYNVLINAVQAMDPDGGVLTVRGKRHNGVVRIEVADQGPGIPHANRERIFEPLFTTKQRGIGLGLSVSRSLAQANGGDLSVGHQDPRGARFCLDLPVVTETRP